MLSGIMMLFLQDWQRIFQLWFILCIIIFIFDSVAEKYFRDSALKAIAVVPRSEPMWLANAARSHWAVVIQTTCTSLIFILMLLHSHQQFELLNLNIFSHWLD